MPAGIEHGLPAPHPDLLRDVDDASFPDRGRQRRRRRTGLDAHQDAGVRRGVEEEPRFGLAEGAGSDHPLGLLVVGVNLDRQPVGAIEDLGQQREAPAVAAVDCLSEQRTAALGRQIGELPPGQRAVYHDALAVGEPRFSDRRLRGAQELPAPHALAELRLEHQQLLTEYLFGSNRAG